MAAETAFGADCASNTSLWAEGSGSYDWQGRLSSKQAVLGWGVSGCRAHATS